MLFVHRTTASAVAFDRLIRDGMIHALTPAIALPADIPATPGLRARAIAPLVPRHTVVSGVAGLWVRRGGPTLVHLDVAGPRGLHRVVDAGSSHGLTVAFHSGRAAIDEPDVVDTLRIASAPRCAADALRWDEHTHAVPAVWHALTAGLLTAEAIARTVADDDVHGRGYTRMAAAWHGVGSAWANRQCARRSPQ